MKPTARETKEFSDLLGLIRDGQIRPEQEERLDQLLELYPSLQQDYIEYMLLCETLHSYQSLAAEDYSTWPRESFASEPSTERIREVERYARQQLEAFLEQEHPKSAPQSVYARQWDLAEKVHDLLQTVHRWTRIAIRTVKIGFVCGILILTGLIVAILIKDRMVVAVLQGTVSAQWETAPDKLELCRGWMTLEQGYAQIRFIQGAQILAEGPCTLRLDGPNRLFLDSGSISAQVPPEAVGFTVTTPSSYVKDFGTEFGVAVDASQATELHVFKGEVGIRCQHGSKRSMKRLKQGQAALAKITGVLNIGRISSSSKRFVRRLPEKKLFINLADVVGGGNGLGTGQLDSGINPFTGAPATFDESYMELVQESPTFVPVPWNAFVDGVFIPNRSDPPLPISQTGLKFNAWPITRNACSMAIINGAKFGHEPNGPRFESIHQGNLKNQVMGTTAHPTIRMQSNVGITFDLQAIRVANPQWRISRFRVYCGISMGIDAKAAFWVLADGHSVFQQTLTGASMPANIDIALEENVRFLTLATTDAGGTTFQDWCMFAEPVLELIPKESENSEE